MHVTKLGLEGNIPSLFYGDETNCCTYNGSWSKSYICSPIDYWAWNSSFFLGHLWCAYPSDLWSYLREMGSLRSDLRDMDFSFCLWFCWCCFLNNSITCWGSILPLIAVFFCLIYLFYKLVLSSSSSNWDIRIPLLVVLVFGHFSFLRDMCIGFKGFLMNLSFKLCLLFLSS